MSNHLSLWNKVCETPLRYTKEVALGRRKFTSIDAQYQVMKATEVFGQYGVGWGIDDIQYEFVTHGDQTSVIMRGTLWYMQDERREIPVIVDDKFTPGQDVFKKLQTQLQSKGLSKLGFSADAFLGMFEDAKYLEEAKERDRQSGFVRQALVAVNAAKDAAALEKIGTRARQYSYDGKMSPEGLAEIQDAIQERMQTIAQLSGKAAGKAST
jgi:hypothetical protein